MRVRLLGLLLLGLGSVALGQPGYDNKGPSGLADLKNGPSGNQPAGQPGFVPNLDLNVNNNQNNQKGGPAGGLLGGGKGPDNNNGNGAEVDILPENIIATEAIATADVPSDFVRECVAIRLREYADASYAYSYAMDGGVDATGASSSASSSRKEPSSSSLAAAAQRIQSQLSSKQAQLLALLNSYVKSGVLRKLRDEGAQLQPIYDYGCKPGYAASCDYSNPMIVGYSAHERVCFDARLASASQVGQAALKSGATDVESLSHVASEKQQLKGELVAIQRATAEAFIKAQDIAFTLFLIQGPQFNRNKHGAAGFDDKSGNGNAGYFGMYGSFGGYGVGMPFKDDYFYDDRYDSGKGYDSENFYDDFFHMGSFFNSALKDRQAQNNQHNARNEANNFREPALQLIKIACKRIDGNHVEAGLSYPVQMRNEKQQYADSVRMADISASGSSDDYSRYGDNSRYYPMPAMMTPVSIAVTVKCDLVTQLVEEDDNNKHGL